MTNLPIDLIILRHYLIIASGMGASGTNLGGFRSFMDITANQTYILFHTVSSF
jgi:hypothetical protein